MTALKDRVSRHPDYSSHEAATIASVTRSGPSAKPADNPYFVQWTDQFSVPAMILAEDCAVLWSNPAADAILASGKDFQLHNGVVACADKAQGQDFRAFLAALGDDVEAWVYRRDDAVHQLVRAEALRVDHMPRVVALMVYAIDGEDRFYWSDFHKVFGLTPAETVVVKRIVGGEPAEMIAKDLSVALDTIRTHLRRIYLKLGINNREQLFSKVSAFRTR